MSNHKLNQKGQLQAHQNSADLNLDEKSINVSQRLSTDSPDPVDEINFKRFLKKHFQYKNLSPEAMKRILDSTINS